ncbi:hypothetical protein RMATCC62417_01848 [Rhizopus microsporus]|nr:hypothetical protein RMATCC62417_01848 [Rhizopus microsporus]
MKTSMGMQVNIGLESPKSFGLLVEGWRCKLYSMELVEDGVYLPAMIKRFWIVEGLIFVKRELEEFKDTLKSRFKKHSTQSLKKNKNFYSLFSNANHCTRIKRFFFNAKEAYPDCHFIINKCSESSKTMHNFV